MKQLIVRPRVISLPMRIRKPLKLTMSPSLRKRNYAFPGNYKSNSDRNQSNTTGGKTAVGRLPIRSHLCSGGHGRGGGEGGVLGPTPSPLKVSSKGLRSHFGGEGVGDNFPPSPLFVPPKQNNRLVCIYKAVILCLGRESNPHGLFGPRDFLAAMAFATGGKCLPVRSLDYSFTIERGSLGVPCLVSAPSSFQRLGSRLPSALPVKVSLNLRHSTSLFSESALNYV